MGEHPTEHRLRIGVPGGAVDVQVDQKQCSTAVLPD